MMRSQVLCHFLCEFLHFFHTQIYPYCPIKTQRKWIIPSSIFIFTFIFLIFSVYEIFMKITKTVCCGYRESLIIAGQF